MTTDNNSTTSSSNNTMRLERELAALTNQWLDLVSLDVEIVNDGGLTQTLYKYKRRVQLLEELAKKGSGEKPYSEQIREHLTYVNNRESILEDELCELVQEGAA